MNKFQWLKKNNIVNGNLFVVYGKNTYEVKDELKAAGAHYHRDLGWFFGDDKDYDVPEGFKLFNYDINNILEWTQSGPIAKYDKRDELKALHEVGREIPKPTQEQLNSDFYGAVGERIRNAVATFVSVRFVDSQWGGSYLYTFKIKDDILVWFSQSESGLLIDPNTEIILSGTVKDHKEYNGVKQTYLTRCIIKER